MSTWTTDGKAKPANLIDLDLILRMEREKEEIKKDTTEVSAINELCNMAQHFRQHYRRGLKTRT